MVDAYIAFLVPLEASYTLSVVLLQDQLLLVELIVLSPYMILAGGQPCQDGWAAPSMRLQAFRFRQLTNLSFTSKVLIMRLLVDFGGNMNEHSHFEEILTGWVFQSVRMLMWLLGGASPEVSSFLMSGSIISSDIRVLRQLPRRHYAPTDTHIFVCLVRPVLALLQRIMKNFFIIN